MLTTKQFLERVITCPDPGWFCLAVRNGTTGWFEEWHRWPQDIDKIVTRADAAKATADVYFSTYLFRMPESIKINVLQGTRTLQADLDDADIANLPREPSVLIETSPGRHQAYWILEEGVTLDEHENISRKLTYSIPLCDRSGWPLGRKVRLPGTLNHKYLTGPKSVQIVRETQNTYPPEDLEILPEVPKFLLEHFDETFLETPDGVSIHPQELLERIADRLPTVVYMAYSTVQLDRSEALWSLMNYAFKAGLNRREVFTLAKGSANNKFADLRHRADQDLAKDVLRAEHSAKSTGKDTREVVHHLFKNQLPAIDRKRQIFSVVLSAMREQGVFLHAKNGISYYIRRDHGRPIPVTAQSETLTTLLDIQFGLNYTEPEAAYVRQGLKAYAANLPETATVSSLSYFDPANQHMLLHTGRKSVLRIRPDSIDTVTDGAYDVVFPWDMSVDPFEPVQGRGDRAVDWGEELFGNGKRGFGGSVYNLTNMTCEEGMSLLKVWFMFLLFRSAASSRPIIATFGQPGSGKSTLFKKLYRILYGERKSLNAITTAENFDHATSQQALAIFDNVDTWEKWLPDRMALSAATSDVPIRKLYTDADTYTLTRTAIVGVTAHNPKFGREDVADRLLLFGYRRFETDFVAEEDIYADLMTRRNQIWGAIVADIQKILGTPMPTDNALPQFRIADFAKYGVWIARALGCEQHFVSAIHDVRSAQQSFSLEEEGLLVNAVAKFADSQRKREKGPEFYTSSQLWPILESCADEPKAFGVLYKNAVHLSKKLSTMQASLKKIVEIDQTTNDQGIKMWRMAAKVGE